MNFYDILLAKKLNEGGGGDITVEGLSVTENATYTAPEGKAYSPVVVNVPAPPLPENAYLIKDAEAPADIVTFDDGQALPMPSLQIGINAVQSGSGDPSPSNIRPISGFTEGNVSVSGKNLYDKESIIADKAYTSSTHAYQTVPYISTYFIEVKEGTKLTISGMKNWGTSSINCFVDGYQGNYISTVGSRTGGGGIVSPVTVTVPSGAKYLAIACYTGTSDYEQYQDKDTIQVEVGSTATTYEPYNGHTTTISWEDEVGTVYGGTLDVVSGVLTVDRVSKMLDGSESWGGYGTTGSYLRIDDMPSGTDLFGQASYFKNISDVTRDIGIKFGSGNNFIYCMYRDSIDGVSGNDSWKTYLSTHNLQIVYELATPTTYQLSPTTVASILGENNVWADCGQILEGEYFSKEA